MKYIDLFAGVGGFRYGIEAIYKKLGKSEWQEGTLPRQDMSDTSSKPNKRQQATCVYSNEWDKYANECYRKHYGECDNRDIRTVAASEIPDHDLLCGGFPCQSFSVAGKRGGFDDTRGTMFFEIARILKEKQPRYLLLENVKGLLSHDSGRTFQTILGVLSDLGYGVQWQVLNSKDFGVPQNRERVFIIGHLRGTSRPEVFPLAGEAGEIATTNIVIPVLTPDRAKKRQNGRRFKTDGEPAFTLNTQDQHGVLLHAMQWRRTEKGRQARRENQKLGRDYTPFSDGHRELIPKPGKAVGAITAQAVAKDSLLGNDTKIRRLTPTECERLQGFPDGWTTGFSDTQRYKMMGNAVTTNVVSAIISRMI